MFICPRGSHVNLIPWSLPRGLGLRLVQYLSVCSSMGQTYMILHVFIRLNMCLCWRGGDLPELSVWHVRGTGTKVICRAVSLEWSSHCRVNVLQSVFFVQHALPYLIASKGTIVPVSSAAGILCSNPIPIPSWEWDQQKVYFSYYFFLQGIVAMPKTSAYSASKNALHGENNLLSCVDLGMANNSLL